MKISVFGASGFIGRQFCKQTKHQTVCVGRDIIFSNTPTILYLRGTVTNYHVFDEPTKDIKDNLELFIETIDHNRKYSNLEEINLVSSWFVYGKTDLPAKEDATCDPQGFYSITARAREQLLISYCKTFGLNYRILRLAGVMGVGDHKASLKKNAVQYLIQEICHNRPVRIYDQIHIRDFIDVRDVVTAIDLILDKGELNQIYNVGNGIGYSVPELIDYAAKKLNRRQLVTTMSVPHFHTIVQAVDMYLDISKLKALGYHPRYTILDTLDWIIKEHYEE